MVVTTSFLHPAQTQVRGTLLEIKLTWKNRAFPSFVVKQLLFSLLFRLIEVDEETLRLNKSLGEETKEISLKCSNIVPVERQLLMNVQVILLTQNRIRPNFVIECSSCRLRLYNRRSGLVSSFRDRTVVYKRESMKFLILIQKNCRSFGKSLCERLMV